MEEEPAVCLRDTDCSRYSFCGDQGSWCRCQSWGECQIKRDYGAYCVSVTQCNEGLVCISKTCRCKWHEKYNNDLGTCSPQIHMDDLPRFADLPDPDHESLAEIPATYSGPFLVAAISLSLVVLFLALAAWCRFTAPSRPYRSEPHAIILTSCPDPNINKFSSIQRTNGNPDRSSTLVLNEKM
ncbi:uncharacterized protein LOC142322593 [Lycorma delicatula]|uniref:uncharacterized protein LOC142322593 n=1 Tax=Lycorma delicatula TaxID=130591 RepID=UPI003F519969